MTSSSLDWLPPCEGWKEAVARIETDADPWSRLIALANTRLSASQTNQIDRIRAKVFSHVRPDSLTTRPLRLAVLSSSTVSHLLPAIRVGALRRGIWVETYEAAFGAYHQELLDSASALHAFAPDVVLFSFDAPHLVGALPVSASQEVADAFHAQTLERLRVLWALAQDRLQGLVLQQTIMPVALPLVGGNEHHLAGSSHHAIARLNVALRGAARAASVALVALDDQVVRHGLYAWYDPVWWLRAKQEIAPQAAPLYGDLVARLMAADQGLSKKCLVLDLDNTLWGGVVGDDGLGGIVLGQGSAEGEAYVSVQTYARDLSTRGIILAIVSKNDEENALAVFRDHPEMVLRRDDIAVFLANWDDKAQNLRRVASALGIGLDALVFVDDNPFERELVRAELPMVAVPELPEDPALYAPLIASAGYFEALSVTAEDRARASYYRSNAERSADVAQAADLPAYLASLAMTLSWRPFDDVGLNRIVQLVNKTNQFNLTTRRTTDAEARVLVEDPEVIGLQFRLVDRFGDNGMIGVIVARRDASDTLTIENWLMSCRVLGRQVEAAMLEVLVQVASEQGIRHLIGCYRPSAKNGIVAKHYENLGFTAIADASDGTRYRLDLESYFPEGGPIKIARG